MKLKRNNLDKSNSPYLQQHAENPVWWQEWDYDVIEGAKRLNMPLFVSVGYATCHWCHVMAHESFEDKKTADFLNKHFVSIKIDREERPDLDDIYQHVIQLTGRSGGWPLSRMYWEGTIFLRNGTADFLRPSICLH